ncbi:hypothetical protein [Aliamphritea spongicola]|nr:hypothetical protein [Aliamphritea spongicola]
MSQDAIIQQLSAIVGADNIYTKHARPSTTAVASGPVKATRWPWSFQQPCSSNGRY